MSNQSYKDQMFRIVRGEIGPSNLTQNEATKMFQTIENRIAHPDIKSDIYNPTEYNTLKYKNQDYNLSKEKNDILESAWQAKDTTKNDGKLGWDTSQDSIKSNKYYDWKADTTKTGAHYYYDAKKK